jgi:hypothetical protein
MSFILFILGLVTLKIIQNSMWDGKGKSNGNPKSGWF